MNFDEFREQLRDDLKERLAERTGQTFDISLSDVAKLQNAGYSGIVVRKEGNPLGLNLDASAIYKEFEKGSFDYGEALDKITDAALHGFDTAPAFDMESLTNYDSKTNLLSNEKTLLHHLIEPCTLCFLRKKRNRPRSHRYARTGEPRCA